MKNEREITERMLWERKKKKKVRKKEKTFQQQKGLPTLSVALKKITGGERLFLQI